MKFWGFRKGSEVSGRYGFAEGIRGVQKGVMGQQEIQRELVGGWLKEHRKNTIEPMVRQRDDIAVELDSVRRRSIIASEGGKSG